MVIRLNQQNARKMNFWILCIRTVYVKYLCSHCPFLKSARILSCVEYKCAVSLNYSMTVCCTRVKINKLDFIYFFRPPPDGEVGASDNCLDHRLNRFDSVNFVNRISLCHNPGFCSAVMEICILSPPARPWSTHCGVAPFYFQWVHYFSSFVSLYPTVQLTC